jgi:hypothetical protein
MAIPKPYHTKIGQLKIMELRKKGAKIELEKFDIKSSMKSSRVWCCAIGFL